MSFDLSSYQSLGEAFRQRCAHFSSKVALIEVNRDEERIRLTYEEVSQESERIAARLQELGFVPGDRCAILMSNQSKWLMSGIGVLWAGGVLVPLDYRLTAQEQCVLVHHSDPKVLIIEWLLWERFIKEEVKLPSQLSVFVTEAPPEVEVSPAQRWESGTSHPFQYAGRTLEDIAAILYSSGTGGRMKGCMLSHGNYLTQVQQFHAHAQFRESDRFLSILPTNHAVDFVFGFLYPLLRGTTVIHQRTLRPQYVSSTLKQYRVDATALVPVILKEFQKGIEKRLNALSPLEKKTVRLLIHLNRWLTPQPQQWLSRLLFKRIHDELGGQLRLILTGGTLVNSDLVEFFYDFGFFVGVGYGLTEAGTTVSAPLWNSRCEDSVGKVLPDTQVQIRNVDEYGVGEIWVRSPSVMKGYFKDPELTAEFLVDGWLRTDDLGSLDSQGILKISGRLKNMIVTAGGKNIYPEDIELTFEDLPGLKEQCVFATHYVWPTVFGVEEKLFIVVHPHDNVEPAEVMRELRSRNRKLDGHKRISGFVLWTEDFPRVSTLKVKRYQLAQELAQTFKPDDIKALIESDQEITSGLHSKIVE